MSKSTVMRPPGPVSKLPFGLKQVVGMATNPAGFLGEMAAYGDIVYYKAAFNDVYLLNHPDFIRDVLVTEQRNFVKGESVTLLKELLGEGVFTADGPAHLQPRRMLQPSFHKQRLAAYAGTMAAYSESKQAAWQDGGTIDLTEEMKQLTLAIVTKTLFDIDVAADKPELAGALNALHDWATRFLLPIQVVRLIEKLPLASNRRFKAAKVYLDTTMDELVAQRRAESLERGDLLSLLLELYPAGKEVENDADRVVRTELLTFFLAGHETTALALMWAWSLLAQHPEAEAKLQAELDSVLGDNAPGLESYPQLKYTEQVFREALRLYPPAYVIPRYALNEVRIGGYLIPKGALVLVSPYLMQRDGRFFEEPEKFRPERWTPEFRAALPKMAYFPFGGGPRLCIGEPFAWMEGVMVLATLAQGWKMRLAPDQSLALNPKLTLRPKHSIHMRLEKRFRSVPSFTVKTEASLC